MDRRKLLCFNPASADDAFVDELRTRGWEVFSAADLNEAKNLIDIHRFHIGVVILGQREETDLAPVQSLLAMRYMMEWVALLPQEALQYRDVCQLISQSFYDFHSLPVDVDRLQITLGHAYGMAHVMKRLRSHIGGHGDDGILGCGPKISKVFADVGRASAVDVPVLITGESGSGKELAARAIHRRSMRADKPFVIVSCGALASNLMQAELFGYDKGAFAGANRMKVGSIEAATGGTVFLDEVGDLPAELQAMLVRFLQDKAIRRIGGSEEIPVDVRIIAATHVDLQKTVAAGMFREDLYHELNVFHIGIPPLRERQEDIELLARYYLDLFANEKYRHISGFAPEAVAAMQRYEWPGNVRELVNRVRRAMVMCEGQWISPADLGFTEPESPVGTMFHQNMTLEEAKAEAEREIIKLTLRVTENNISRAARHLAVSRMTLYRLMHKHRIKGPSEQREASTNN